MQIVVDTREQHPFPFQRFEDVEIEYRALKTGDYSLSDYENVITVERKELNDFLNSITNDRTRFEKEIVRMSKIKHGFVIVEKDFEHILNKVIQKGTFSYKTVIGTVASWSIKYKVNFLFMQSRVFAEETTYRIFKNFLKAEAERQKVVLSGF